MSRGVKRKMKEIDPTLLRKEKLILICEWESCRELHEDMELFLAHVAKHAGQVRIEVISKDEGNEMSSFTCLWEECEYQTVNEREILRHIYYHAYHTKVKSLGATLIERLGLQGCQLGTHNRNTIPELPEPFVCGWVDCSVEFLNVQHFYWHIQTHSAEVPLDQVQCLWEDCNHKFGTRTKLKDHLRFHSQERPISCPTCGTLFASRTKLHDHCLRQLPQEAQEFKCPTCEKHLPTERILRDHMRCHQAVYDCPYCPAGKKKRSFQSTSALASHITYCHNEVRPFACTHDDCTYSFKTQADLTRHVETHASSVWYCQNPGCSFMAHSVHTLQRHIRNTHEGKSKPVYECHECQQTYNFANSLRRHVIRKHIIKPPAGEKFRYLLGMDGIYRIEISGSDPATD